MWRMMPYVCMISVVVAKTDNNHTRNPPNASIFQLKLSDKLSIVCDIEKSAVDVFPSNVDMDSDTSGSRPWSWWWRRQHPKKSNHSTPPLLVPTAIPPVVSVYLLQEDFQQGWAGIFVVAVMAAIFVADGMDMAWCRLSVTNTAVQCAALLKHWFVLVYLLSMVSTSPDSLKHSIRITGSSQRPCLLVLIAVSTTKRQVKCRCSWQQFLLSFLLAPTISKIGPAIHRFGSDPLFLHGKGRGERSKLMDDFSTTVIWLSSCHHCQSMLERPYPSKKSWWSCRRHGQTMH